MTSSTYSTCMKRAAIASVAIHAIALASVALWPEDDSIGLGPEKEEPIKVSLRQPEPDVPSRFIDSQTEAPQDPVSPQTDLISDRNSKASDASDVQGKRPAPFFEKPEDFDLLGGPAAPAPTPVPPSPVEQPETKAAKEEEPEPVKPEPDPPEKPSETIPPEPEPEQEKPQEERVQLAKLDPPALERDRPTESKGRIDGGIKSKGFTGFEAMEHELGPYLKEVRKKVERYWHGVLEMRYSGASKTKAVLECAISPDGKLVHVKIAEAGDSATYAHLCKQAIEKAAPFPPFPFDVPAVYREKNLEIRWTFSYL